MKNSLKPNCLNGKIGMGVPSRYLREPFQKLLKMIRKYFTCEIRLDIIYPHHIILLMHFTSKRSLKLPFFLHQSLGGMANNIQAEENQPNKNLSHISLIKLLIVEELRRLGKEWDFFMISVDIPRDPKGDIPLPTGEATSCCVETEIDGAAGKGKIMEFLSPQQPIPCKRGSPRKNKDLGEAQAPNEPYIQSIAEKLLMCVVWLEPVEISRQKICDRRRRPGT
jgi:hypothetical protein